MKIEATYGTLLVWRDNCAEILEEYETQTGLPMELEWAVLYNFKQFEKALQKYHSLQSGLVNRYGTLQTDGTYAIDETSEQAVTLYNEAVKQLDGKFAKVNMERINHKCLRGFKGIGINTMSLLAFMVD
ncbi:MAG: hypothetical protein PHS82_06155 [Lachnospiraceae bacterium]|nr:hypothetical protein [Lachnospiraceae bacterium]